VPYGSLTSVEQSLVGHVSRGEWLDLAADDEVVDQAAMQSWGESRTCRATVIRDILRGRFAADPDPHGLRLRGARITGRIDLEILTTEVNFELEDCLLEEGLFAQDAQLASLSLTRCQLEHPTEPPLDAARLTCGVLALEGARIIGHAEAGAVRLTGAHIGGDLDCTGAVLVNDSGPALYAGRLQVGQAMYLSDGFTTTGAGDDGAVNLVGAHIGGDLDCTGAVLVNDSGPAVAADRLQVGQDMFLRNGFTATGAGDLGAVSLSSAGIGGDLDCDGADLRNDSGPALYADSLQVGQAIFLRGGFTATGAGDNGAVSLRGAGIGGQFDCTGATVRNDSGPALYADGLQVGQAMYLRGAFTATGAVNVVGAHIGGQLSCDGATVRNDSGPALYADRLQVDRDVFLTDGFTATGAGDDGAVNLVGAHIGGNLDCTGAVLVNDSGPAVAADSLQVGQDVTLRGGFTATGAGDNGAVNLRGAHIGGRLSCTGATLVNDSGPALYADALQVDRDMYLRGAFTATGAGDHSAVNLLAAHIGGQLSCTGATLGNDSGPALYADALQVDQDLFLDGFTATGAGDNGAVNLLGAHIGGDLTCDGADLRNDSGPAVAADRLQVGQDVYLRGAFTATGAVNMRGAHIGGGLDCTGATVRNDSGPALHAGSLQVGQDVTLRGGFTAVGVGDNGAVSLSGAHIGGGLDCTGATVRNDSGPALHAGSLQVGQDVYLRGGFTATGAGDTVAVALTGAQVGATLVFDPARLEHAADPHRRLAVDGLTYAGVPEPISARDWLDLLRNGTPGYAAQPYQQLAAGYRALGDERQAREILMKQRDGQLTRTDPRPWWPERLWGKITKITLGYGYQPWRALLFLAAVVALSCVLAVALGSHGALAQTGSTATPGQPCTLLQQVTVGLDLNLPIGKSVAREQCDLAKESASAAAAWLTATGWVLQLLAWVFAALFIAGFTSAVRKT